MYPYELRDTAEFLNESARIQEFYYLQRDATRKWGNPNSLCEMSASIRKTVEDKKHKTAFQSKLLISEHRSFKFGIILPIKLSDYPNFNLILKKEIKQAIAQGIFFNKEFNENLARKTFPNLYVSCLKTSMEEICED